MGMTIVEKIVAKNTVSGICSPGDIVLLNPDFLTASDWDGTHSVSFFEQNALHFSNPDKVVLFTESGISGGLFQQYENQRVFRQFSHKYNIRFFDVEEGIGGQCLIDKGLVYPAAVHLSNSVRACMAGAVGGLGLCVSYSQLAQLWSGDSFKFTVPNSSKIILKGKRPKGLSGRDIAMNIIDALGIDCFYGDVLEISGDEAKRFTLDERISIATLAPELGVLSVFFDTSTDILDFCNFRSKKKNKSLVADEDATYKIVHELDISKFSARLSLPEKPLESVDVLAACDIKIDLAFVGGFLNGRLQDMREIASILRNRKVAHGVKFFISPSSREVWTDCLNEGLFHVFLQAGAIVLQAGETGCFPHQAGVTVANELCISTTISNYKSQTGLGKTYLASALTVSTSAVAGCICTLENIPDEPVLLNIVDSLVFPKVSFQMPQQEDIIVGRCVVLNSSFFATEKIIPNRVLVYGSADEIFNSVFAEYNKLAEEETDKVVSGDILVAGSCFGAPYCSRQFLENLISFGIKAILADSFHHHFQQNANDMGFVAMSIKNLSSFGFESNQYISIDLINKTISKVEAP